MFTYIHNDFGVVTVRILGSFEPDFDFTRGNLPPNILHDRHRYYLSDAIFHAIMGASMSIDGRAAMERSMAIDKEIEEDLRQRDKKRKILLLSEFLKPGSSSLLGYICSQIDVRYTMQVQKSRAKAPL